MGDGMAVLAPDHDLGRARGLTAELAAGELALGVVDTAGTVAPDKLRILTIAACPMPARRGTPVRIERLSEALAARGHAVTIATYHIGESANLGATERLSAVELVRTIQPFTLGTLPPGPTLAKLLRYDPGLFSATRRLLASRRFDVIHAHHVEGLLIGALARPRGVPLVYDAHTMLASELPSYFIPGLRPVARQMAGRLDAWLPRLADHVICAGAGVRDTLIERHHLAQHRVTVAWNGVEIEYFAAAAAARTAGSLRGAPHRVLYSGTLAGYQDIDLLLEAFAQLHRTHPETRLVLGTTSTLGTLSARAQALGIASAIDIETDDFAALPARLGGAAMAVSPRTRCDGVPQKLLNYMAAGCPIVASRGSAPVLEHGATGLVVENHDVDGFAQAMRRIIDEPELAAALGSRAHATVADRFSWDATARTVEGVYQSVVRATARPPAGTVPTKRLVERRPLPPCSAGQSTIETNHSALEQASC